MRAGDTIWMPSVDSTDHMAAARAALHTLRSLRSQASSKKLFNSSLVTSAIEICERSACSVASGSLNVLAGTGFFHMKIMLPHSCENWKRSSRSPFGLSHSMRAGTFRFLGTSIGCSEPTTVRCFDCREPGTNTHNASMLCHDGWSPQAV
jgi:hypothetical protein